LQNSSQAGGTGFPACAKAVEGRGSINEPQFSKMLFMKEYQADILQI
jgi:hypothetical protein